MVFRTFKLSQFHRNFLYHALKYGILKSYRESKLRNI